MSSLDREKAFALLTEYTKSDSLIKHCLGVEAAVSYYAKKFNEDVVLWGITGLLHDFDYEKYPEWKLENGVGSGHPFTGCQILRDAGYSEIMIEAILGHAQYSGVPRTTPLAKTLFACDELSGLVTAATLVRPDRSIHNLEVSSVKKKMKDKAFARGVNRDDIHLGVSEIEIPLDEHIENVIQAMRLSADALGLSGTVSL